MLPKPTHLNRASHGPDARLGPADVEGSVPTPTLPIECQQRTLWAILANAQTVSSRWEYSVQYLAPLMMCNPGRSQAKGSGFGPQVIPLIAYT